MRKDKYIKSLECMVAEEAKYYDFFSYSDKLKFMKNVISLSLVLGVIFFVNGKSSKNVNVHNSVINLHSYFDNTLEENRNRIFNSICDKYLRDSSILVEEDQRENLYIGDSRMKGMLKSGAIDQNHTVYGVGYGYNWLVGDGNFNSSKTNASNGALNGIYSKMEEDKLYNIIIWLGVNDYRRNDAYKYFEKFSELALGEFFNHNIYVVSVGPVNDRRATTVNNEQINNFNGTMQELIENAGISNLKYIDLDYVQSSVKSYDSVGLHYGMSDYINISQIINDFILEDKTVKVLHK